VNSVAQATIYPVTCPGCDTITSQRAAQILQRPYVNCRRCDTTITLNESQLNRIRRTIADLSECLQRAPLSTTQVGEQA
jgi:uncharacterized paraquat-inducible protein A